MNFTTFWTNLKALEEAIAITSPVSKTVKRAYWGAPPETTKDLPCIINALSETGRVLEFGSRDQIMRVNVQMLVAKARVEDTRSSEIATAFWFAAKDAFDADYNLSGAVSFMTLRGSDPTVPVLLQHGGQAYIGFNAYLDIQVNEAFAFRTEDFEPGHLITVDLPEYGLNDDELLIERVTAYNPANSN